MGKLSNSTVILNKTTFSRPSGQEGVAKKNPSHRDAAGTPNKTESEHNLQTQQGSQTTAAPPLQQQKAKGNSDGQQGGSRDTEEPREVTKK